ncbi:type 4 pilus major pilin [Pseudomonas aeruginosa]
MSTTQRTSRPTQGGFVSIEMIIVLIIIAIGVGLGLAAAAGMFSSSEEQRNISVIAANARALKTSSGYGSSGTNLIPSLIAINGVPKNMSVSSGVVYNVYGGSVTVSSTGMGFSITTSKLPQDACITLATKIAKNTFEQTKINSGSAITGEVTTAAATQACSSDSNSITWTYSS